MRIDSNPSLFIQTLALALVFVLPVSANAQDPVDRSIIFMAANYGYMNYDADRQFDDRDFGGVTMGLHFNRRWSASLFYSRSHPDNQTGDNNRFENYYVQGKRYWREHSPWRPYVVLGLGEMLQGEGRVASDAAIHGGVGVHWAINPKWAWQLDYRYFYAFNDSFQEQSLMASIVYRVGDGER